jgi:hypothetical protein
VEHFIGHTYVILIRHTVSSFGHRTDILVPIVIPVLCRFGFFVCALAFAWFRSMVRPFIRRAWEWIARACFMIAFLFILVGVSE